MKKTAGDITGADMATLTSLTAKNLISDLGGLEYDVELKSLNLGGNNIKANTAGKMSASFLSYIAKLLLWEIFPRGKMDIKLFTR